jgi:hypothetical protein
MHSELATVRGVLASLRSKIRLAWTIRGVSITVAAVAAAAVVSFALDYLLDLPLVVRGIHLVLMLVAVALVARWALLVPLRTPMIEADLAEAVEHGSPDLRDRLLSALDFEKRLGDASETESRELMAAVVRDAASAASRLDAGLLVDSRPARRALGGAAAAVLVLVVTALAMPDEFALWLRRGVLLSAETWPRRTHLRLVDFPTAGPRIVTRGDDVRIVAVAEGELPSEVTVHFEELSEPDPSKGPDQPMSVTYADTRRMYPLEAEPSGATRTEAGRFAFDFHAVSASFRLWVTGGDDQDQEPVYLVTALVPPRVASISGKIVYPKYTGLPDGEVRDASFEVLAGSRVEMAIVANMKLAGARMVPADGTAPTTLQLGPDGKSMALSFDVNQAIDFHLELTAPQGLTNRAEDDVFHLRAGQDRPPELRVLYPPARLYRTPRGIVPIKFVAKDDFQVAGVALEVTVGSAPPGKSELWPVPGEPPAADRRKVGAYRPLDLQDFAGDRGPTLKHGDLLHVLLRATDSHGNETDSGELAVEIMSEDAFERLLSQKQSTLREDLALVRRNQQRTRTALAELRAEAAKSAAAAAAGRGRDVQVDAGRVTNDIVQFLTGIRQVFDSYVLDRVGAGTTIDKLVPLYHEALAQPSDDQVFPASLYERIVAEKRADRLYDPDVLGALLDIMDLGDRAAGEVSPSVGKELAAWAEDKAKDPAALERAEKAATELGALLAEIDQRMQRWGEMNLLIEMARDIRNTQDQLSKDPAGTKGLAPK